MWNKKSVCAGACSQGTQWVSGESKYPQSESGEGRDSQEIQLVYCASLGQERVALFRT